MQICFNNKTIKKYIYIFDQVLFFEVNLFSEKISNFFILTKTVIEKIYVKQIYYTRVSIN